MGQPESAGYYTIHSQQIYDLGDFSFYYPLSILFMNQNKENKTAPVELGFRARSFLTGLYPHLSRRATYTFTIPSTGCSSCPHNAIVIKYNKGLEST